MKDQLNKAILLAAIYHDGQYDRGGEPYLLHVLKVMHYLKTDDEELQCIAVLHDIVEDTAIELENLEASGYNFSKRIIDGIQALTKINGESYDDYLERVMSNRDAVLVKMCDLRHNMDIRRLKGVTPKDMKRIEKYAKAYQKLKNYMENYIYDH